MEALLPLCPRDSPIIWDYKILPTKIIDRRSQWCRVSQNDRCRTHFPLSPDCYPADPPAPFRAWCSWNLPDNQSINNTPPTHQAGFPAAADGAGSSWWTETGNCHCKYLIKYILVIISTSQDDHRKTWKKREMGESQNRNCLNHRSVISAAALSWKSRLVRQFEPQ